MAKLVETEHEREQRYAAQDRVIEASGPSTGKREDTLKIGSPADYRVETARKQGFAEGYVAGQTDRQLRLECIQIASKGREGWPPADINAAAQLLYNWVAMTEEQRAQPAAV